MSDAYWEWVDDLPSEFKSESEYNEMLADEVCEEKYDYDKCETCPSHKNCDLRRRFLSQI